MLLIHGNILKPGCRIGAKYFYLSPTPAKEFEKQVPPCKSLAVWTGDSRMHWKLSQVRRKLFSVHPLAFAPDIEANRVFHRNGLQSKSQRVASSGVSKHIQKLIRIQQRPTQRRQPMIAHQLHRGRRLLR